jgi:hypothetical protein
MDRTLDISRVICGALVFISGLMSLGVFPWEPPGRRAGGTALSSGDARSRVLHADHDSDVSNHWH